VLCLNGAVTEAGDDEYAGGGSLIEFLKALSSE